LPIIAQMTVGVDGNTSYGASVETIASSLSCDDVSVVGINCSVGPASMLDAVERLAEATRLPVSAQPNAGMPRAVGDRKIYLASPEYVAQYAKRMINAGARFVGGCCGTTPDHIKHIRGYVQSVQPRNSAGAVIIPVAGDVVEVQAVPLDERSNLGRKLAGGEFVCTVELTPPRGWQADAIVRDAAALKNAGIDAVSVVDTARAQSRMGAQAAALIVERDAGIETVLHYTCRDRNMLGMVSDLLGAAASGLRNLLLVTGDPPAMGPYPDSTAVFDIDSIGLTNVVHRLNQGLDPGGGNIGKPTRYVTGVAFNQGAVDLQRELERFAWKVEAGAEFAVTQPVFDSAQLGAFLQHTKGWTIPVIAGIWPLISVRDAEFLANEVPGVHVPQAVIERMARAQERGSDVARAEGQRIALEIFQEIADKVQGVHVSTPSGDAGVALEFVERAMPRARS
jgi:homocysteine S-methyltransferase